MLVINFTKFILYLHELQIPDTIYLIAGFWASGCRGKSRQEPSHGLLGGAA